MRKGCQCRVPIMCSCCSKQFSCLCALHLHLLEYKNVLKYLIDTVSCRAEIVAENITESTEECVSGNTASCDVDILFDTDNISHPGSCENSEKTNETTSQLKVENKSYHQHDQSSGALQIDQLNIKDDYEEKTEDEALNDAMVDTEQQSEQSTDNSDADENTSSEQPDMHPPKQMTDTSQLRCDHLLSGDVEVPCDICGRVFKRRNLKRHMQSHALEKEFTCEICQKVFRTRSSLYGHKLHHRTERDHICQYCGKQFNNGSNLRQHIKSHTKKKTLKCPLCPKMFGRNYILKDHISRHSGEKPHACTICSRSFKKPEEVKRHMIFHSDARDHACSICNKRFKSKGNRVKHEKIHNRKEKDRVENVT